MGGLFLACMCIYILLFSHMLSGVGGFYKLYTLHFLDMVLRGLINPQSIGPHISPQCQLNRRWGKVCEENFYTALKARDSLQQTKQASMSSLEIDPGYRFRMCCCPNGNAPRGSPEYFVPSAVWESCETFRKRNMVRSGSLWADFLRCSLSPTLLSEHGNGDELAFFAHHQASCSSWYVSPANIHCLSRPESHNKTFPH